MIPDTLSVKMLPEENEGGSLAQKGMPVEAPIDRYYRPGFLFPVPSEGNPCNSDKRDDGHSFGSSSFRARYSRVFIRRLLLPSIRWRSIEQGWSFDRVTSVSMAEGKDEGRPKWRRREAAIVRREANKFPGQRRIKRAILLSRFGPKAPRQFHGLFHGRPSLIFHPLWKPGNPVHDSHRRFYRGCPEDSQNSPTSAWSRAYTYPLGGRAGSFVVDVAQRARVPRVTTAAALEGVKSAERRP